MAWRAVKSVIQSWLAFWVSVAWLGVFTLANTLSGELWLKPLYFEVPKTHAGKPIPANFGRIVYREFVADWVFTARRVTETGSIIACTASGTASYRPGMGLPDPVTFDWLSQGRCPTLEPGYYTADIVWSIHTFFGRKLVRIESNRFEVVP